jgi:hypothetical protein
MQMMGIFEALMRCMSSAIPPLSSFPAIPSTSSMRRMRFFDVLDRDCDEVASAIEASKSFLDLEGSNLTVVKTLLEKARA